MSFDAKFELVINFDDLCDSGSTGEFADMLRAISRVAGFRVIEAKYRLDWWPKTEWRDAFTEQLTVGGN